MTNTDALDQLSVKSQRYLREAGCSVAADLVRVRRADLQRVRGCGILALRSIEADLLAHGLYLADRDPRIKLTDLRQKRHAIAADLERLDKQIQTVEASLK